MRQLVAALGMASFIVLSLSGLAAAASLIIDPPPGSANAYWTPRPQLFCPQGVVLDLAGWTCTGS